jgi:hypothetical protein
MQHVVVQMPSAPWLGRVAHTVLAAWAAFEDLTLDEIVDARLLLDDMLATLLEVSNGPVTMRLSSTLRIELSAPLRLGAGHDGDHAVLHSSLRRHGELP